MNNNEIIKAIIKQGMLPLFYHADADVSIAITKALYNAGIRVIEYTNRGINALNNFNRLLQERDSNMPGLIIGIGTIKSDADAVKYVDADADFIICPGVIPSVAKIVHQSNQLWIPGCMTTTEIMIAEQAGATMVKLFPGNLLGPSFVSSIKDLFPNLLFMPTGGVDTTKENISSWFKAGVCAVGMGSKLLTKEIMDQKNYSEIEAKTSEVLALITAVKNIK